MYLDFSTSTANHIVNGLKVNLVKANSQKDQGLGIVKGIVLHWTAGPYDMVFDDYHFNVVFDNAHAQAYVVRTLKPTDKGSHIWGRNSGLIGVTMSCMADGHPVKAQQVEVMSQLVAELCAWKQLDPRGTYTTDTKQSNDSQIWTTGNHLEAPVIADHHWFAKHDGYESARWDIGDYYPQVVAKAQAHYDKLKAHTVQFQWKDLISG